VFPYYVLREESGKGMTKGWECGFEETNILNGTGVL
jgi:hypothetical protein